MIGYLQGDIIHCDPDSILLKAGDVGYEILLNPFTLEQVRAAGSGDGKVALFIYFHVTERQPKPVLIGFASLRDKQFFQLFITVSAIGPMKAVKALSRPVTTVARAIEEKDVASLSQLPGIGKRTAEKIIATLHGKVLAFVGSDPLPSSESLDEQVSPTAKEIGQQVADVLVEQLGHSTGSAQRMIQAAFSRNPDIQTPEALFDEIYQEAGQ